MLLFALIAFVLAVMFMTLPVISLSKLTITERRTRKLSTKAKPFWEKYFVDVLLLVVSGYLLYNNNRQKAVIAAEIIGAVNGSVGEKLYESKIYLQKFVFPC